MNEYTPAAIILAALLALKIGAVLWCSISIRLGVAWMCTRWRPLALTVAGLALALGIVGLVVGWRIVVVADMLAGGILSVVALALHFRELREARSLRVELPSATARWGRR